jgi:hypothetical protein
MTYTPLVAVLAVLVLGAATTLTILFAAARRGAFKNLKSGAYVIFDEDEPVGTPQDQWFHDGAATEDAEEDPRSSPSS